MDIKQLENIAITNCYHCGDECKNNSILFDDHSFCCEGCKTVYDLLSENGLCKYYDFEKNPGITIKTKSFEHQFDFLDDPTIIEKIIDFSDNKITKITFHIPKIHCTSCIWLLENLHKIENGIYQSEVNFFKKTVSFTYQHDIISLKKLVELISSIGYEPEITLDKIKIKNVKKDYSFTYKIGVAGFAFGNIMLFSFPEYFHLNELVDPGFRSFFGYLNIMLSLPVLLYSASGYFTSAYIGLKQRIVNIDVPLSLGILIMFIRSSYDIISGTGAGFMDALAGLVFFLLIGKWFQNKSYQALSFERDYTSYFPLSITRIENQKETSCSLDKLDSNDVIMIRNSELIPADGVIMEGNAIIDYSFVTGESAPVNKNKGDKVFAGGKQTGGIIYIQLTKSVSQSYLTSLWNHPLFNKENNTPYLSDRTNQISKFFTITILLIAIISGIYWILMDSSKAMDAFTSVLIITCPCALALTIPFTFGNSLRIFGKNELYLKNADKIEELNKIDSIVFDKTGTITTTSAGEVIYEGMPLNEETCSLICAAVKSSTHPLSKSIYQSLYNGQEIETLPVIEYPGKGIKCLNLRIGSEEFITGKKNMTSDFTSSVVYVSLHGNVLGKFRIQNVYRSGIKEMIDRLRLSNYQLHILSGDQDSEKEALKKIFGEDTPMHFKQTPDLKLKYIEELQLSGKAVMMLGDGLNDAGALKKANIGIAVADENGTFFPACDGMLKSSHIHQLDSFLLQAKQSMNIVKASFFISLIYNIIGLSFAVKGELLPVIAAVLMPVSSVSIIAFTTLLTTIRGYRNKLI